MNSSSALNLMMRAFAVCAVALIVSGCATRVGFDPHAPYSAPVRVNAPLVLVFPDDVDLMSYEWNPGTALEFKKYRINYGEALKYEAEARFRNMFSGVYLATFSEYQEAMDPGSTDAEIAFQGLGPALPEDGYVLFFDVIGFDLSSARPSYRADVRLQDVLTDEVIFAARTGGSGSTLPAKSERSFLGRKVREGTINAASGLLRGLTPSMIEAIRERPRLQSAAPTAPAAAAL